MSRIASLHSLIDILRSGAWLTRPRMRVAALAVLAASAVGFLYLVVTADGLNDYQGRPLGSDFSNVYAAGSLVLDGRAQAPYDPAQLYEREKAIFGRDTPFYGWHSMPVYLFVAAALASMPYPLALVVWQGVTLALYLAALWAIGRSGGRRTRADPLWLLLALAFPAVLINVGHGHNGFLTAALLGGGLVLLDRRPALAGVLLGLLVYKPPFAALVMLVLAASHRWRALAAVAATIAALALAATLAFGPEVWRAFLDSTDFTRRVVLEQGGIGWHKIQTVFAAARSWGAPVAFAYAAQGAIIAVVSAALVWVWRSGAEFALKAAALSIALMLAPPYNVDFDLATLAPAIAFLATHGFARGFAPYEKTALAALWLMPLVARTVAQNTLFPLGVLTMLVVFALIVRHAAAARSPGWLFASRPLK